MSPQHSLVQATTLCSVQYSKKRRHARTSTCRSLVLRCFASSIRVSGWAPCSQFQPSQASCVPSMSESESESKSEPEPDIEFLPRAACPALSHMAIGARTIDVY